MDRLLIYDIGCNNGDDTEFYLRKGFKVVALDADRSMCELVSERFASEIQKGLLKVVFGAVSETPGDVIFYVNDAGTGINTSDPYFVENNEKNLRGTYRKVVVPAVDVKNLFEEHGTPYYMKIDVEGSDIVPLKSIENCGEVPLYTSLEVAVHDLALGLEQINLLKKLGYNKFLFVNQGVKSLVRAPQPPREGAYAPFDPDGHNTGLFGKELDGNWGDFDWAIRRFRQINALHLLFRDNPWFSKNRMFGGTLLSKIYNRYRRHVLNDPVAWFDIHATIG